MKHSALDVSLKPVLPEKLPPYSNPIPDINIKAVEIPHVPIPADSPPAVSTFEFLDEEQPDLPPELSDIKPPTKTKTTNQNPLNEANSNCYFVNKYISEYNKWYKIKEITEYSSLDPSIEEESTWENYLPFSKIKVVQPILPIPPIPQGTSFLKEALEERQPLSSLLQGFRTMKHQRR